jgi:uncharacterized protein (DUF1499 family)
VTHHVEIVFCAIAFLLIVLVLIGIVQAMRRRRPRLILTVFAWCLAAAGVGIWVAVPQFPRRIRTALQTNIAETSPTPEFPELRTRVYATTPSRVFDAISALVKSHPGKWELVSADQAAGRIHATTRVVGFTDDVFVSVQPEGASTRVDVRSQSRVGKGDFGENRRHIAWLLEGLDGSLR